MPINLLQNYLKKRKAKKELKTKILSQGQVDFTLTAKNIAQSMGKSKIFYQELATKVHPDKFLDERNKATATELFKKVENSRNNYSKLLELENEVNEFIRKK